MHLVCNSDIRYDLATIECSQVRPFPQNSLLAIYVTYHDDKSLQVISSLLKYDIFRLIKIPQTRYDENFIFYPPISPMIIDNSREYSGMLLYSFACKGLCMDYEALVRKYRDTVDVFVFQWSGVSVLKDMSAHGPEAVELLKHIIHKLGLNPDDFHDIPSIWKNCWICKTSLFKKYTGFVKAAIDIMEKDPRCIELANMNSYWNRGYSQEKLQAMYKHPYQTLHGFIVERLPAIFFKAWSAKIHYTIMQRELTHAYCRECS
jgi:hypothetical protein